MAKRQILTPPTACWGRTREAPEGIESIRFIPHRQLLRNRPLPQQAVGGSS